MTTSGRSSTGSRRSATPRSSPIRRSPHVFLKTGGSSIPVANAGRSMFPSSTSLPARSRGADRATPPTRRTHSPNRYPLITHARLRFQLGRRKYRVGPYPCVLDGPELRLERRSSLGPAAGGGSPGGISGRRHAVEDDDVHPACEY